MKYLETKNERISFTVATVILLLLALLCILFSLSYFDPPPENGIAINFGTSDVGMGDIQPTEPVRSAPQPTPTPPQTAPVEEQVVTQDVEDAPVISNEKPTKQPPKEQVKPTPKPTPAPPTPSKATNDALNSLINGPKSDGKANGGEGNDNKAGDKGRIDGTLGGDYNGGSGGGNTRGGNGNYQLGNRGALAKPSPKYTCNEQGTVVVQISVNRSGKVIEANSGVRGTTNAASCLLEQARIAAMNTTWEPDPDAPDKQIGKIIYNFKLTD
ncbi:energy transducer TonB family protein [Flavobacterium rhizosphaerae]|uniref:Energy transducer TonB n=1 Tax=Flavobacterium rhizosphaerae TaxID=3163298 RepID=A0ABW8Z063_9FLAO